MLTSADRCDHCGAQACFAVFFEKSELLFCRHHANEHAAALEDAGRELFDFSGGSQ